MDECYACIVGAATGPESHSEGCPLATSRTVPVEHRVYTRHEDDRSYWECSCGRSGSAAAMMVDMASDRHIQDAGGRRIDTNRSFDPGEA